MKFGENSIIEYEPFGGGTRRVLVTNREADGKNGRPTFDGVLLHPNNSPVVDGEGEAEQVWGYDSQLIRVVQL